MWLWWSSGKDSAWALQLLRQDPEVSVERLITTVTPTFGRVAIHGTRISVLEAQASAVGVPLQLIVCLDPKHLGPEHAGARFDHAFLGKLPESVDPCGEGGEFHTCATSGPMFQRSLDVSLGEVVEREGFVYADLLLDE